MKEVKQMNPAACRAIRALLEKELPGILYESGLSFDLGSARYSDTDVTFKVKLFLGGVDPAQAEFEKVCGLFDLEPSHYGATFRVRGETFTLCGLKPRSPKWAVRGMNANGECYKFKESILTEIRNDAIAAIVSGSK
tara:strand:+ start:2772 stop:3182 length:411 start_codon:yes stop_codon:yes gene_type:complete